jgi:prephenate dehydrogenase
MTQFQSGTVAFIGLGLISGSLARALRASSWNGTLTAWGPREASLQRGVELGVIDHYSLELSEVLAVADMVVVGAPPAATGETLRSIVNVLSGLNRTPIVTDLASIKGHVIDSMACEYANFVPGHPIAGSEHSGVAFADGALFRGREVILTPLAHTAADAIEQVKAMWDLTGAYIRQMGVEEHDALLAASSHMPHIVAYALTRALERDGSDPMVHGGGALRDMTRIAGSDPLMWTDISVTNQPALVKAIDAFQAEMASLRRLIASADTAALHDYFAVCRAHRRVHDDILNPLLAAESEESS